MRNFIVTIEGKQYNVGVEEVGASASVQSITSVAAPSVAAAPTAPAAPKAAITNGTNVNAPMPGMIKKLSVAEGATVKKGDVILVLEAMKMDNDISAPCDGTVSFKTTAGSNVDTGVLLAIIG